MTGGLFSNFSIFTIGVVVLLGFLAIAVITGRRDTGSRRNNVKIIADVLQVAEDGAKET